jgi:hypothetical protein
MGNTNINYNPSPGLSAHATHRQLLTNQVEEIFKLSKAKLNLAQISFQL